MTYFNCKKPAWNGSRSSPSAPLGQKQFEMRKCVGWNLKYFAFRKIFSRPFLSFHSHFQRQNNFEPKILKKKKISTDILKLTFNKAAKIKKKHIQGKKTVQGKNYLDHTILMSEMSFCHNIWQPMVITRLFHKRILKYNKKQIWYLKYQAVAWCRHLG